jgi:hypothetical protein
MADIDCRRRIPLPLKYSEAPRRSTMHVYLYISNARNLHKIRSIHPSSNQRKKAFPAKHIFTDAKTLNGFTLSAGGFNLSTFSRKLFANILQFKRATFNNCKFFMFENTGYFFIKGFKCCDVGKLITGTAISRNLVENSINKLWSISVQIFKPKMRSKNIFSARFYTIGIKCEQQILAKNLK